MTEKIFIVLTILLYSVFGSPSDLFSQGKTDCKEMLRCVFDEMMEPGYQVPEGKAYYMDYSVSSELRGAENQAGVERIQAVLTANQIRVQSDHMEIYSSPIETFTVLPLEKKIYWADSDNRFGSGVRQQYTFRLQDSLFAYSTVKTCHTVSKDTQDLQRVVLQLSEKGKRSLNYQELDFLFYPDQKKLFSSIITFGDRGQYERIEMRFFEISYDYKGQFSPIDFNETYIRNGKLVSDKYADYDLIDVRK
ncbi:MAG: hypothetical protein AAF927_03650 [Bacteroidota bacterium]